MIKIVTDRERLLMRLAVRVQEDRAAKGSQSKADRESKISRSTWIRIEEGKPIQRHNYSAVETYLDWPQGSIRRFLEEGGPEPRKPEVDEDRSAAGEAAWDRGETPEEIAAIRALLRAMRGELDR